MKRILTSALAVALLCSAAGAAPAGAASAAPRGTLTGTEYTQISAGRAAVTKLSRNKIVNWNLVRAACRKAGTSTALVRSERANCLSATELLSTLYGFDATEQQCSTSASSTTGTTTTGTTTTGTTTGTTTTGTTTPSGFTTEQLAVLVCLNPTYQTLSRDVKADYKASQATHRQIVVRGFTGACAATLGATSAQLKLQKRFNAATRVLADDVALLVKISLGEASTSAASYTQIQSDATTFERTADAALDGKKPPKLSICPHQ